MIFDDLVNDPRFLPYHGWHDDHRDKDKTPGYLPAIQQVRSEFLELLSLFISTPFTSSIKPNGKCLQLGLGIPGGSHFLFEQCFKEVWTIEHDVNAVCQYISRHLSDSDDGYWLWPVDSHNPGLSTKQSIIDVGPYDLLFIDAGHTYNDVEQDWCDYASLVKRGGIIAFHDSLPREGYPEVEVWRFIDSLKYSGNDINTIGTEVGISWMVQK